MSWKANLDQQDAIKQQVGQQWNGEDRNIVIQWLFGFANQANSVLIHHSADR